MKKKLTQTELAAAHGVKQSTLSLLLAGKRTTSIVKLAILAGKLTGRPGIEFICPKRREIYLKAYPRLGTTREKLRPELKDYGVDVLQAMIKDR